MDVLARGSNFEITADGRVARCSVVNSPQIDRDEGARCAQLMEDTLSNQVLSRRSTYAALVFDVRHGPEVFGPRTRSALEELFRAAELAGKRLAVRVGSGAIQRLQFSSLCRECAPTQAKVVFSDHDEELWLKALAAR
jgi:hypothetical protein